MPESIRDVIAGGVLLLFSGLLLLLIPYQVEVEDPSTLTAAFLPTAAAGAIVFLSAVLLIQGAWHHLHHPQASAGGPAAKASIFVIAVLAACVGYVAAMPYLGYLAATGAVLAVLGWLYGLRRWHRLLLIVLLVPPVIFAFFRYVMLVLLPEGALFG